MEINQLLIFVRYREANLTILFKRNVNNFCNFCINTDTGSIPL